MTEETTIELTPAQVLRLERASASVARLYEVYAVPIKQINAAESDLQKTYGEVIEGAGHEMNGAKWEIVEDGDAVRLVRRTE